ncbi:MAG: cysteine-rich small domain-containing protein [Christensenellales bacterium]
MENSRFFANKACPYYPCHGDADNFSCLFCFCPLYALGESCGGDYKYTDSGVKDCSNCAIPHRAENYDYIIKRSVEVVELVRKK